jgi:hypothetical protein
MRTCCLPPGHRPLAENSAAEILIIADIRREVICRYIFEQNYRAARGGDRRLRKRSSTLYHMQVAAPRTARRSVLSGHRVDWDDGSGSEVGWRSGGNQMTR